MSDVKRLDALVVREKDGKKFWTRVGVAFPCKGDGWTVHLDANPIDGKIVLMPHTDKPGDAAAPAPAGDPKLDF